MTSPVVPPTLTAPPPAPDRADRNTFSARATAQSAFYKDTMTPEMQEAIDATYTNAVSAGESAVAALANKDASYTNVLTSAANAANAAASAGATQWASGSYSTGARVWSPTNQRLYRRLSPGGASPTDPASDPTNWASVPIDLPVEIVTGTSGTLRANVRTVATNAAACAFTAPTLVAGDSFEVDFTNGRLNNSIDIAAQTIKGPNGSTASGVITHNVRGLLRLYSDGTNLRSAS